jgi:hypothetical protein
LILLAALLVCAGLGAEKVELRFAPAEGSKVRRTITLDHVLVVQEVATVSAAGTQSSQDQISYKAHQVLRTLDEYRKVADGRPLLLQRRFDEIAWTGSFEFPDGKEQISAVSPLTGASVLYTWVPTEGAYGRYYDRRESPEEALLRLEEDLDLRALLPAGPVGVGETWSVPADKLAGVFGPAGRLSLQFDAKRPRLNLLRTLRCGLAGNYGEFFGGESTGQCKLKLAAPGAADAGRPLARLELEVELEQKLDQRGLMQAQLTGAELLSGYKCNRAPASWSFKGTGTLVWDLAAKRASSFTLQGEQKLQFESELSIGGQPPVAQRMKLAGALSFAWRIADPAEPEPGPGAPQGQK